MLNATQMDERMKKITRQRNYFAAALLEATSQEHLDEVTADIDKRVSTGTSLAEEVMKELDEIQKEADAAAIQEGSLSHLEQAAQAKIEELESRIKVLTEKLAGHEKTIENLGVQWNDQCNKVCAECDEWKEKYLALEKQAPPDALVTENPTSTVIDKPVTIVDITPDNYFK